MTNIFELLNTLTSEYAPDSPGVCYEGEEFLAYISARDPESQPVTYKLISGSLPLGAVFDPQAGSISGVLSLNDVISNVALPQDYTWIFTMGAADGFNNPSGDPQVFSITVKHKAVAPVWVSAQGGLLFSLYEGDSISNAQIINHSGVALHSGNLQVVPAYDIQGFPITYSVASGLPSGISLTSTGIFHGSLPLLTSNYVPRNGSVYNFQIIANNGIISSTENCAIQLYNVNQMPFWITPAGNLGSYPERSYFSLQLIANDVDGNDMIYSIVSGNLEAGTFLSPGGLILGIPLNPIPGQDSTSNFVVSASNLTYSVNRAFSITFTHVDLPPVWNTPTGSLGSSYGGVTFSYRLSATDPQNYALTYSISNGALPTGLTLSSNGVINGLLNTANSNTVSSFTVNVNDGIHSTPNQFSIEVLELPDTPPIWTTNAGVLGSGYSNFLSSGYNLQATESNSAPSPLTYFLSNGSNPLPGTVTLLSNGYLTPGILPNVTNTTALSFSVGAYDGFLESDRIFSILVLQTPHGSQEFTSNGSFVVSNGVSQLNFEWVIGGGGGGGAGNQVGFGGGGGGGGSGGFYNNYSLPVVPGDTIEVFIGSAGIGQNNASIGFGQPEFAGYDGTSGGDTVVKKNGVEVLRATGGAGGSASENVNQGYLIAPPGAGGSPNGVTGSPGPAGTSDYASSVGGAGAAGPMAGSFGGLGGLNSGAGPIHSTSTVPAGSAGSVGIGYGSGGGGGGSTDRASPGIWCGASGVQGYVLITY